MEHVKNVFVVTRFPQLINSINLQMDLNLECACIFVTKAALPLNYDGNKENFDFLLKFFFAVEFIEDITNLYSFQGFDNLIYYSDVGHEKDCLGQLDYKQLILIEEGLATYVDDVCESWRGRFGFWRKGLARRIGGSRLQAHLYVYKSEWLLKNSRVLSRNGSSILPFRFPYFFVIEENFRFLLDIYRCSSSWLDNVNNSRILLVPFEDGVQNLLIPKVMDLVFGGGYECIIVKGHPAQNAFFNLDMDVRDIPVIYLPAHIPLELAVLKLKRNCNVIDVIDYGSSSVFYASRFFRNISYVVTNKFSEKIYSIRSAGLY